MPDDHAQHGLRVGKMWSGDRQRDARMARGGRERQHRPVIVVGTAEHVPDGQADQSEEDECDSVPPRPRR